jgi:predicted transglutaminase-like cysteine proteinase
MKDFKLRPKFRTAVLAGLTALGVLTSYKGEPASPSSSVTVTQLVPGKAVNVNIVKNLDYPGEGRWSVWNHRQDSCLANDSNRVHYQAWLAGLDGAKGLFLLEQVNQVNDLVNNTVTYVSDSENYGVDNYWASGAQTICSGAGDCEDFALAKLYALKYLGVSENRMSILDVASDPAFSKEIDHAVLAVDTSAANNWINCLILNNYEGSRNSLKTLEQTGYLPYYMINTNQMRHCKIKTLKSPAP